jgi:hypothetical protein
MKSARILIALAMTGLAQAAHGADLPTTAPYDPRERDAFIYRPHVEADTIWSGSRDMRYRRDHERFLPYPFRYPLDGASIYFPPHPAAEANTRKPLYRTGRRIIIRERVPVTRLPLAHLEWCYGRYASYRASDNSFLPPSGLRRTCVSPYL